LNSILSKIVEHKKHEVAQAKLDQPLKSLSGKLADAPEPRDFLARLESPDEVSLIAEVKKASPSKGLIREDFHPAKIGALYESGGASCISVLTDEKFFQGHLDFLTSVRQAVSIPVLRKDFIIDEYQVVEARAAGADAVLLIAECLEPTLLKDLYDSIVGLNMTALVELYDATNVDLVLNCNPQLVGVNNRDLNTFEVDLNHSVEVKKMLPDELTFVSESGIFTHDDVKFLMSHDVDAMLVGESLMRCDDIELAVRSLIGGA